MKRTSRMISRQSKNANQFALALPKSKVLPAPASATAPAPKEAPRSIVRTNHNGQPPPPGVIHSKQESKKADEVARIRQVAEKISMDGKKKKVRL